MGKCKNNLFLFNKTGEIFRFFHCHGHGLFAHYVEAVLDKFFSKSIMQVVWRNNGNNLYSFVGRQGQLAFNELVDVGITSVR